MRLHLSLLAILMCALVHAQGPVTTPGSVRDASTLPSPLDPNGDGWITTTGGAFTGPVDETEFEIPFVPIPEYQPEPVPDNQVPSTSCVMYELVGDAANGVESTYYYYQDPDGIAGNGDERVFFRFRVARMTSSSVGLSVLIDTDHKFGFSGPEADINAVVGNPGFELEVSLVYTGGPDIRVYDVDGVASPSVVKATYPTATYLQAAYALNQDPDCAARIPGFIDIYLPFSALGISSTTPIRMVGASGELTGSMLGGRASDISGVDGTAIATDDNQFIAVIGNFPPFSFEDGNNGAPVSADATVSLNENSANGAAVHTVSASNPDGDALTYTITTGNTGTAFAINNSGQITVNNTTALNYEVTPSFTLNVVVSDGTLSDNAVITINLNNVNEAPSAADATVNLNENAPNSTTVHTVSASDPDGNVLTYTITGGNTGTAFAINNSGQITVNNVTALNYEVTPSFTLTVTVSDGTLFDSAVITINLNNANEAPSAADATVNLNENAPYSTTVHTVSASDPDGNALTYTITGGNTGTAFAVNNSGQITVNNATALTYEVTPSFTLIIVVSDGTLSDNAVITINLNNVNEAPSAADATVTLNENTANATTLHTVVASDPDGNALTYTITTGNTGTAFAISSSGQITVNNTAALNYEVTPSFTLTIEVSDGTLSDNAVITINLNNVNEAPSAADATVTLNENAPNSTTVHTVSASDPDGNALTYTITGGNTGTAFVVNNSGQITVNNATALNYELTPSFTLNVVVSDGTLSDNAVITINLNNVNEAPSAADATVSLNENAAHATTVHSAAASDPEGNALTYTITTGNTGTAFAISGSGEITVNNTAALNYEDTPSFTVNVVVSDGTVSGNAVITINLNNVNEAPSAADATVSLNEHPATATIVHTVSASDPDGDALTYTITGGNTSTAFAANSAGEIVINNASAVDFETTPSYTLTVKVSDGSLFDEALVTINLVEVNLAPSAVDASISLYENSANGTLVHAVAAADPEGDMLTYEITGGNRENTFLINHDGVISVNNSSQLDFETNPIFIITVKVGDGTQFAESKVTISLQDINEAPRMDGAVITIASNLPSGTIIHKMLSEDPDIDDTSVFFIEEGNANSAFMLNESTGEISILDTEQFDLFVNPAFELTIMVRDAGGLSATANLTIRLESFDQEDRIDPLKGFSPNGDGINDFWLIRGIEAFPDNEVKVFSRWGNLVFETRNYNNDNIAWRGLTGKNVAETTYYFLISVQGLQPITGYVVVKQ